MYVIIQMLLYQIVLSMKLFKITLFSKIYWQHNKLIILLCLTLQTLCSSKTVKVLAVKGVKTRFFFLILSCLERIQVERLTLSNIFKSIPIFLFYHQSFQSYLKMFLAQNFNKQVIYI